MFWIYNSLVEVLGLLSWKDSFQIIVLAYAFFKISSWLAQDRTKPLLGWVYAYSFALGCSWLLDLSILLRLLVQVGPIFGVFCIILHQNTLQKHGISYKKNIVTPATIAPENWVQTLLRTCMLATHHGKSITCVIERHDDMSQFLQSDFSLHTPIKNSLLQLVLYSSHFHSNKVMWCNKQGHLVSINATWHSELDNDLSTRSVHEPIWRQYSAALCKKTDAVVFHMSPTQQYTTVFAGSDIITDLTNQQVIDVIKRFMHHKPKNQKGRHVSSPPLQKQTNS